MTGNEAKEVWRVIKLYDNYSVSTNGSVRSDIRRKVLHQYEDKDGYLKVALSSHSVQKRFLVHRLVAEAFIPNPEGKPCINHKDGNKQNNCVENLEWCTLSENQRHRRYVLKSGLRKVTCVETGAMYESLVEAAKLNGLHAPNIIRACKTKLTSGGYHWNYV